MKKFQKNCRIKIVYEYKLDEVRYFWIWFDKSNPTIKFVQPHCYFSWSSLVCFMFTKKRLFRILICLIHDDRSPNYKNLVEWYARAVNWKYLYDLMISYSHQNKEICHKIYLKWIDDNFKF